MMGRIQSRYKSPRYPCPSERLAGNEIAHASSHPFCWYCYCALVARARFSRHLVGGKMVSEKLIIATKTPTFRQCCLHQGKPFSTHSNGIQTKTVTQRIEIKALD